MDFWKKGLRVMKVECKEMKGLWRVMREERVRRRRWKSKAHALNINTRNKNKTINLKIMYFKNEKQSCCWKVLTG
jgi:hypothetical protein